MAEPAMELGSTNWLPSHTLTSYCIHALHTSGFHFIADIISLVTMYHTYKAYRNAISGKLIL